MTVHSYPVDAIEQGVGNDPVRHTGIMRGPLATATLFAPMITSACVAISIGHATDEWGWPLTPRPPVVRDFDNPEHDWLPGHRGVDLVGEPGQSVLAAGDGAVTYVGTIAGTPIVTVSHDGGLRTTYEPVRASVTIGESVERGTILGELEPGHRNCPAPACLHWGLLRRDETTDTDPHGEYLDPLGLLRLKPIRLKAVALRSLSLSGQRKGSVRISWSPSPSRGVSEHNTPLARKGSPFGSGSQTGTARASGNRPVAMP